jgi:hypothetical protein
MTATIAWMRPHARVARCAKRAARSDPRNFGGVRTQPAGNLEADADLNEGRGAPGHWSSSLAFLNEYVKS